MIEVLICECQQCTHWEIVRDKDGKVHLLCKTCLRVDPIELTLDVNHLSASWEKRDKE